MSRDGRRRGRRDGGEDVRRPACASCCVRRRRRGESAASAQRARVRSSASPGHGDAREAQRRAPAATGVMHLPPRRTARRRRSTCSVTPRGAVGSRPAPPEQIARWSAATSCAACAAQAGDRGLAVRCVEAGVGGDRAWWTKSRITCPSTASERGGCARASAAKAPAKPIWSRQSKTSPEARRSDPRRARGWGRSQWAARRPGDEQRRPLVRSGTSARTRVKSGPAHQPASTPRSCAARSQLGVPAGHRRPCAHGRAPQRRPFAGHFPAGPPC